MSYPLTSSAVGTGKIDQVRSQPIPISPMQDARNLLLSSIVTLHERVSEMERRLEEICVPSMSTGQDNPDGRQGGPSSSHRLFIAEQANGIYIVVARLESLLARLEF